MYILRHLESHILFTPTATTYHQYPNVNLPRTRLSPLCEILQGYQYVILDCSYGKVFNIMQVAPSTSIKYTKVSYAL